MEEAAESALAMRNITEHSRTRERLSKGQEAEKWAKSMDMKDGRKKDA